MGEMGSFSRVRRYLLCCVISICLALGALSFYMPECDNTIFIRIVSVTGIILSALFVSF